MELGMAGRKRETGGSLNRMVLLHLAKMSTDKNWNVTSVIYCCNGLNFPAVVTNKCDFINMPKNAVRQIAQKAKSKLERKFKRCQILKSRSTVMGGFC